MKMKTLIISLIYNHACKNSVYQGQTRKGSKRNFKHFQLDVFVTYFCRVSPYNQITISEALPSALGSAQCICEALCMFLSLQNNAELCSMHNSGLKWSHNRSFNCIASMMSCHTWCLQEKITGLYCTPSMTGPETE